MGIGRIPQIRPMININGMFITFIITGADENNITVAHKNPTATLIIPDAIEEVPKVAPNKTSIEIFMRDAITISIKGLTFFVSHETRSMISKTKNQFSIKYLNRVKISL